MQVTVMIDALADAAQAALRTTRRRGMEGRAATSAATGGERDDAASGQPLADDFDGLIGADIDA